MKKVTIGKATLYHGNCMEILENISQDCGVLTDPPYGISFDYSKKRGSSLSNFKGNRGWSNIIGDDGPFDAGPLLRFKNQIIWGANNFSDLLPASRGWLIWDKRGDTTSDNFGDAELAWTSIDMVIRRHVQQWRGIVRQGEENISNGPKIHPAQKPLSLMRWCLNFLKEPVILDPYMGSGSAGIAAIEYGREFIGIEIDETHFKTACVRFEKHQRQGSLFSYRSPEDD